MAGFIPYLQVKRESLHNAACVADKYVNGGVHHPQTCAHARLAHAPARCGLSVLKMSPQEGLEKDLAVELEKDLEKLTNEKLRDKCRELGIPVTGNKDQLLERLRTKNKLADTVGVGEMERPSASPSKQTDPQQATSSQGASLVEISRKGGGRRNVSSSAAIPESAEKAVPLASTGKGFAPRSKQPQSQPQTRMRVPDAAQELSIAAQRAKSTAQGRVLETKV